MVESKLAGLLVVLGALSLLISSATWAVADEYSFRVDGERIRSCVTIDEPGKYVLVTDLTVEAGGTCIEIRSSDVRFDGNGHLLRGPFTSGSAAVAVVDSNELRNVSVSDLRVSNWELGVGARGVANLSISGIAATENVNGIFVFESNAVRISDSSVADGYYGITSMLSEDVVIRGNDVRSDNRSGVTVYESRNVSVLDNFVTETEYGTWLYESTEVIVRNNTIVRNQAFETDGTFQDRVRAISLVRSHDNTIANNVVSHNRPPDDTPNAYGLSLIESDRNVVRGNNATNNNIGLWMSLSDGNVIDSNAFDVNYLGLVLRESSNNDVASNTANGNQYGGVVLHYDSDDNRLVDNIANDNVYGITVIGPGGDPFTEAGVLDAERYEFGSSGNRLQGNRANGNEVNGVSLYGTVIDTVLSENEATNNGQNGFYLFLASNASIQQNVGSSNGDVGFYLADADGNTIVDNEACQNGDGSIVLDERSEGNALDESGQNCPGGDD